MGTDKSHQDAIYAKVEKMVRPILESNARRFAKQLGMTQEEAMQEARFGLMLALREYSYNDSRGGIYRYLQVTIRRHFLKRWGEARTQARRPHLKTIDPKTGKRRAFPMPFVDAVVADGIVRDMMRDGGNVPGRNLVYKGQAVFDFLDLVESPVSAPDAGLIEADQEESMGQFERALNERLRMKSSKTYERDCKVLRCKLDPPDGLRMLMCDELTDEPTIPLIGKYLGMSKNEVDWAVRRIRDAALYLISRDFSDLADLAVVRAYVDKRP